MPLITTTTEIHLAASVLPIPWKLKSSMKHQTENSIIHHEQKNLSWRATNTQGSSKKPHFALQMCVRSETSTSERSDKAYSPQIGRWGARCASWVPRPGCTPTLASTPSEETRHRLCWHRFSALAAAGRSCSTSTSSWSWPRTELSELSVVHAVGDRYLRRSDVTAMRPPPWAMTRCVWKLKTVCDGRARCCKSSCSWERITIGK